MNTRYMFRALLLTVFLITYVAPSHSLAQAAPVTVDVLKWSPDGTRLAGGYSDGTVKIWNPTTGEVELSLEGHTRQIHDIAWSPDGEKLIAGGSDDFAYIWNVANGLVVGNLSDVGTSIETVGWVANNRIITFEWQSANSFRTWDATSYELLQQQLSGNIIAVTVSPNMLYIGLGNAGGSLIVMDSSNLEMVAAFTTGGSSSAVSWSPDSSLLVNGDAGVVQVWNWMAGTLLFSDQVTEGLGYSDDFVRAVTYSADGQRVASAALDGTIRVWDWTIGQLLFDDQLGVRIIAAAWSPDGRWLAYGAEDGSMSVIAAPVSLTCTHAVSSGDINQLFDHIESINASGIAITICLSSTSTQTFTTPDNGLNALPIIAGDVTIEGNGATLTRDETADPFRFFEVASGGSLTLNNLTLSNGAVDAQGGAILNNGTLTLNNVTFLNNGTHRAPDTGAAEGVGCEGAIYTTPTGSLTINGITCTSLLP